MNQTAYISCFFALLFSVSSIAQHKQESIQQNSIYQSCGHSLFEQDNVINSRAYNEASEEGKQDLLEAEFNKRRRYCYLKELVKVSVTVIPFTFGAYKLYQRIGGNNAAGMGLGGGLMMYGLVGGIFGNILNDITSFIRQRVDSAKSISLSIISPQSADPIEKYEIRYVRQKPTIDKRLQEILEENFIFARTSESENSNHFSFTGRKKESKSPVDFAKAVLSLPATKLKVQYDPNRIDQHLGSFDPAILKQFKRFAIRHAAASTGRSVKKIVAYFKGPPGVGKTLAAERIAQTMQVPFWVIKLGGKSVDDLMGSESEPGLLLEAILKAKFEGKSGKNLVIFLDELDRALGMGGDYEQPMMRPRFGQMPDMRSKFGARGDNSLLTALLTLIEPGTNSAYFPYLGIELDTSGIGFIGAGNFDIEDEALASRFEIIEFSGYTPDFKKNVVKSRIFNDLLAPHLTSELPLSAEDFDVSDWKRINLVIEKDRDPGFRNIIQFVENYLGDKVLCKHYNDCPAEWTKPIEPLPETFESFPLNKETPVPWRDKFFPF